MVILLIYPIIANAPINYSSMDEIKVAWYAIAVFFIIQLVLPIILKSAGYRDPLTFGVIFFRAFGNEENEDQIKLIKKN
jgi:hypothetical protein